MAIYATQSFRFNFLRDICGIQKNITTKLARTTAGVYLLNHDVPIETVSRILGHSNTTTTRAFYAKIMPDKVLADVSMINAVSDAYMQCRNPFGK